MRIFVSAVCLLLLSSAFAWTQEAAPAKSDYSERARAILKEGLDSNDYSIRIEAISAASMIGHNEALISRLEKFLHDKNADVRLATLNTLGDLHTARREQILQAVLADEKNSRGMVRCCQDAGRF
jgi:HEAT repeat protein